MGMRRTTATAAIAPADGPPDRIVAGVAGTSQAPSRPLSRTSPGARLSTLTFIVAVVVFFFLSGASGLIYQVAWVRILSLIFGITVHAVSTVLAGFMAGLALGSALAGRVAPRLRHPLRAYGVVECAIGATGVLTPWAFGWLRDVYPALNSTVEMQAAAWSGSAFLGGLAFWLPGIVRFAVAFGILLVPTTLMGATLPIMLKSSLVQGQSLGRSVSVLYAINTFGAIAGTVGAGFYLIAGYGIQASIRTAAALNVAIGVAALLLSFVVGRAVAGRTVDETASRGRDQGMTARAVAPARTRPLLSEWRLSEWRRPWPGRTVVVALAFGVSGLCALGYEVIWFRLLSLFAFDNSTYAFTVMLSTVLFGIATGSYVITPLMGRLARRINWWLVFAGLEWGIGILAILSITVLSNIDAVVARLTATWPNLATLTKSDDGWMLVAAGAAIVPPMFLSGMTFPVAALLYTRTSPRQVAAGAKESSTESSTENSSRRIGSLYAVNVMGAIAGSTLAGFVLLPQRASQQSLVLLAVGSVLAGALVLWVAPRRETGLWTKEGLTLAGAAALVATLRATPDMYERLQQARFPDQEVVWYREGLESTVTVVRDKEGYITLYTNSRGQARDEGPLVAFHRLLGHWPMLLHPDPQRALIVGIGGGTTSGAVAQHPNVEVDAVELSDAVIDAVRLFGHVNYYFFSLPNVHLIQNDARNHLLLSGRRYDVISGDAIRPNDAGAATLYSLEYYQLCAQALEEDGLMTQWLPPFSDFQYKLILRTFLAAFPHATLWQDGDLLIGSRSPITVDRATLEARFRNPQVRAGMEAVGVPTAGEFLSRFNATTDELRAVAGEGPVITDDRPYLEYFRSLPEDEPPDMKRYSRDVRQILR